MPTYFNVMDVIRGNLPGISARSLMVKSPYLTGNAEVLISEDKFNWSFRSATVNKVTNKPEIGDREQKLRGVTTKDETFATLQIVKAGQTNPEITFKEFILQSAQETSQEKYQLIETFGETVGFFFGSRPKLYRYSGTLVNTSDYLWRDNWKEFYESKLRGTQLVEQKKRAYLTYDFVLREGYILDFSMVQSSAHPNHMDFNFTMFITKEVNLNPAIVEEVQSGVLSITADLPSKAQKIFEGMRNNYDDMKKAFRSATKAASWVAQVGSTVTRSVAKLSLPPEEVTTTPDGIPVTAEEYAMLTDWRTDEAGLGPPAEGESIYSRERIEGVRQYIGQRNLAQPSPAPASTQPEAPYELPSGPISIGIGGVSASVNIGEPPERWHGSHPIGEVKEDGTTNSVTDRGKWEYVETMRGIASSFGVGLYETDVSSQKYGSDVVRSKVVHRVDPASSGSGSSLSTGIRRDVYVQRVQ